MTLSSQGKLGKDAGSVAYYVCERLRTQIQRRHAGSGGKSKKHAEQEAAREAVDRLQEQT
jgi:dsRNA-specific ribonuclease